MAYHGVVTPNQVGRIMVPQASVLLALVKFIEVIPTRRHGARRAGPPVYSDRLFLKALVIMLVRNVSTISGLLAILEQATWEMQACGHADRAGRSPSRRTWERRLAMLPSALPARTGCLERHLVGLIDPWADSGHAIAIDSTVLHARGGVWHKKSGRRGRPAQLDRHRGRKGLARLGLRLEAPPCHHHRVGLDPAGRRAHPSQHRRQ